jgi:hypothetical protein
MLGSDDCSETLLIRSYLIHNSLEKRERGFYCFMLLWNGFLGIFIKWRFASFN